MKKIAAIAAAAVTAMTMTGCGKSFTLEGSSTEYSDEELQKAAVCLEDIDTGDSTKSYCQFLGDMSYEDTARYVNIYYYKQGKDSKDISGDYLAFKVTNYIAKTPSTIVDAISQNMFDINGFRNYFFDGRHEWVVKKDENGDWICLGDMSDIIKPDTDDAIADGKSDIYSSAERKKALEVMTNSDEWADLIGELLYAKYAGDESASKEELDKLNKRNGTAYDECMVMYADLYSYEELAVLKNTKWQLAKDNGVWRVVEYSKSEGENK
ncbi:MAG: hypothetical protein K6F71_08160 [Ruminococcus sp.]|uniref:hypothetical protein n=1 Tax=Ruminococcus sp. TaxID=41978 RepID=UPI0025EA176F|nr:hypothetical protein [Ruminococcus sp.]MCR5540772.1 hypothetical protein [Ruminococcus sp.]